MIVLNGEPFMHYNLRALYPFAHQIVVVEGASPLAAHIATPGGHSTDATLATLQEFQKHEDPQRKLQIVTAEDEGHPDGFWPGEKDQQSQAYARRATGDWLWQIDVDEFYLPGDIRRVCDYLLCHPELRCLTFQAHHFWGGFDYVVEGGLFSSLTFQGEPWGAYRRLFSWEPGASYVTHRPPTVADRAGRTPTARSTRNLTSVLGRPPVRMYHYTNLFPQQVLPKGAYYASLGQPDVRARFEAFERPLDLRGGVQIYRHRGTFNWLRRFQGQHPPAAEQLRADLAAGRVQQRMRHSADIERLLGSWRYRALIGLLRPREWLRECAVLASARARAATKAALRHAPPFVIARLPLRWRAALARSGRA
jgi:hypothetical protein